LLLVTLPNSYPYHPDPIDTLLRPDIEQLCGVFHQLKLLDGGIVEGEQRQSEIRANCEWQERKLERVRAEGHAGCSRSKSRGYAVGVPKNYAWWSGSYKPRVTTAPPADFTAVTGCGQVYPKAGAPQYSNPDGSILIANAETYVHLSATREWIVQDQTTDEITGSHFISDFSAKPSIQMRLV
jgi:hypothetical protein